LPEEKRKASEKELPKEMSSPELPVSSRKWRQIVIETDGNTLRILKADVTALELAEICRRILRNLGVT